MGLGMIILASRKNAVKCIIKKVREQVEKAGYPVIDFSGHEYDKYFLKDTIHLGRKGWIYFDEAVQKFYSEK